MTAENIEPHEPFTGATDFEDTHAAGSELEAGDYSRDDPEADADLLSSNDQATDDDTEPYASEATGQLHIPHQRVPGEVPTNAAAEARDASDAPDAGTDSPDGPIEPPEPPTGGGSSEGAGDDEERHLEPGIVQKYSADTTEWGDPEPAADGPIELSHDTMVVGRGAGTDNAEMVATTLGADQVVTMYRADTTEGAMLLIGEGTQEESSEAMTAAALRAAPALGQAGVKLTILGDQREALSPASDQIPGGDLAGYYRMLLGPGVADMELGHIPSGSTVTINTADGNVRAVDADGNQVWPPQAS